MKIHYNSRNVLFRELEGDQYRLKDVPQNYLNFMLDIGAAYGLISIMARLLHPKMQIIAIEPHPETYIDLVSNVDRLKIKTMNCAFGDGSVFYLEKERKMRLCNSFSKQKNNTTKIQSHTLAEMVKLYKIDPSSLILKIDCEGAEWCMVGNREDEKIIKQSKVLAIEVHDKKGEYSVEGFYDWIGKLVDKTHSVRIDRRSHNLGVVTAMNVIWRSTI